MSYFLTYDTYFIKRNVYGFVCHKQKVVVLFSVYDNAVAMTFAGVFDVSVCVCMPLL